MYYNTLSPGSVLNGNQYNYKIEKVLGQGTFGITYLAKVSLQGQLGQLDINVHVTIKEFFMKEINGREGTSVTASSTGKGGLFYDYKQKFAREAKNLSKLKHPNIVNVMDYFEANNTCYYVMEYLSGGDLDTLIEKRGGLSEEETIRFTRQIGAALSFMHQNKMLHLDLKPKNVMLNTDNDAILIDFGLSKQYDSTGEPESSTTVGRGTPGYAPLEQANYQDGHGFPVTMDVYALGATMYKMLTGVRAPEASVILNDSFPKEVFQEVLCSQRTLNSIIKAMSPMKKDRFGSIDLFLKFLCVQDKKIKDEETTIDIPLRIDNTTQSVEIHYFEGSFPNAISMLLHVNASSCTYELYSYQKHLASGVLSSFHWNDFAKSFNSLNLVHGDERGESCCGGSTTTLFLKDQDSSIVKSTQYGDNQGGTLHGNVLKLIAYFETIQEFREALIAAKNKLYQSKDISESSNKKMPIMDEARKFHFFDYVKGKRFGVKLLLKIVLIPLSMMSFYLGCIAMVSPEAPSILALSAVFGFWILSLCFQKIHVRLDGMEMYNLKFNFLLTKRSVKWDDIEDMTFYTNDTLKAWLELKMTDGSKETINMGCLEENALMIYNAIAAYYNRYYDKQFDWNSIMRDETDREPKVRSILFSVGLFITTFLFIFVILRVVEEQTYSAPLYMTVYDLDQSSQKEMEKKVRAITNAEFLYFGDINKEKKAVVVHIEDKYGVFDYAVNTWLIPPTSTDNFSLLENYIAKIRDDGFFKHHEVAYYDYNGKESFVVKALVYFYLWGALLIALFISFRYYNYRRNNK